MATSARKAAASSQPVLAEAPVAAAEPQVGEQFPLTERLGLAKPTDNSDDWGDDYRRAMEVLDAHPGIRAFAAGQRPENPFDGQVILEQTDPPVLLAYSAEADEWAATDQPVPPGGYTHVQTVASTVWTVIHNLGFPPAGFFVRDSTGRIQEPDIGANNATATVLIFAEPTTGTANVS